MEDEERLICTGEYKLSLDKDYTFSESIKDTQNDNVSDACRTLIEYFNKQQVVYKEELADADNALLMLCSERAYKTILVLMRDSIVKQTGFITYGDRIIITKDFRIEGFNNDNKNLGFFSRCMFSKVKGFGAPQMKTILINKVTYLDGKYN